MGRMFKALGLVFIIEIALLLFPQATYTQTSIYEFVTNPFLWSQSGFLQFLLPLLIGLGISSTIIGSYFNKIDWVFRGTMAATFVTFGASLFHLFSFINGTGLFAGASSSPLLNSSVLMSAIITGPVMLYYLGAVVDFISGKD